MRDNWNEYHLTDIAEYYNGMAFKPIHWKNEGIPIIRIEQITRPDTANWDFYQGNFSKKNEINYGDVIFSWSATLKVVVWKGPKAVLNQHLFKVEEKNGFEKYFVAYLIDFNLGKLADESQGSTMKHVTRKSLEKFKVILPPLPQQQKIAKILSTVDTVIEQTETAIAKYQAIKQGLMHDLFTRGIDVNTGQLRPKQQDAPELYKESALGWIPIDWTEGQFIDFADEHINHSFTGGPFGSDLQTKHYTKEGVRIIQLQNIGDGHFKNDYKIYTSEDRANYLRACNIYPGDIILSKMAEPIARACIIPSFHERYLMASDGIRLSINKKKFNLRFVLETINQKRFRNIAEIRATGTTRSRIGLTELKEIPVCYPKREEQNLIGKKLDDLEESISIEQQALAKYQQLKAGLMQDLLTGKVEVGVDEEIINN